jgi:hypothetical protein
MAYRLVLCSYGEGKVHRQMEGRDTRRGLSILGPVAQNASQTFEVKSIELLVRVLLHDHIWVDREFLNAESSPQRLVVG